MHIRKPEVHHYFHNTLSPIPILTNTSLVRALQHNVLTIHLLISTHLHLGLLYAFPFLEVFHLNPVHISFLPVSVIQFLPTYPPFYLNLQYVSRQVSCGVEVLTRIRRKCKLSGFTHCVTWHLLFHFHF